MRKSLLTGAILLGGAVALGACHPVDFRHNHNAGWLLGHPGWTHHDDSPVTVAASLNCPDQEGDLHRTGMAADGKSCEYQDGKDREATLILVSLSGQSPQAALAPIDAALRSLVPAQSGPSMVNVDADSGPGDQNNAKVDLPGFHVDAHGNQAKIRVLGIDIDADGDNHKADIGIKGTTIHAGPGGAEIRAEDVGQHAVQLAYILAADSAGPSGYRAVGYIARGPVSGPLVVGQFKSKADNHGGQDHDLERLVDLNVTPAS